MPLNAIVCITLVFVGDMSQSTVLLLSTLWLLLALLTLSQLPDTQHMPVQGMPRIRTRSAKYSPGSGGGECCTTTES